MDFVFAHPLLFEALFNSCLLNVDSRSALGRLSARPVSRSPTTDLKTELTGFAIRVVARRTGLSPHVIRVWERRYSAVQPQRTETNRRLYSEADIERLRLLSAATHAGHSIGQIAQLETGQLQDLVHQDAPGELSTPQPQSDDDEPAAIVARALGAVHQLDGESLEKELAHAGIRLSRIRLLEEVVVPLICQVGEAWHQGSLRIAEEHLTSATIRSFVGRLLASDRPNAGAPTIIVTTPTGQSHEIGALLAAASASACGWKVVYLGPQLPAEEICAAALRHSARAIGLSVVYPENDPLIPGELELIRQGVGVGVDMLVGGRVAAAYGNALQEAGAILVQDLAHLRRHLTGASNPNQRVA